MILYIFYTNSDEDFFVVIYYNTSEEWGMNINSIFLRD